MTTKTIADLEKEINKGFICPKCGKIFDEVNGLLVHCVCGYADDSNFYQITNWDKCQAKQDLLIEVKKIIASEIDYLFPRYYEDGVEEFTIQLKQKLGISEKKNE